MYLTDKKAGLPRPPSDHEELEVLLESFSKQVEEIVNESETTMVRTCRGWTHLLCTEGQCPLNNL
jgi:hypothetical protein